MDGITAVTSRVKKTHLRVHSVSYSFVHVLGRDLLLKGKALSTLDLLVLTGLD